MVEEGTSLKNSVCNVVQSFSPEKEGVQQLSLVDLERYYLVGNNANILDEILLRMNSFIEAFSNCGEDNYFSQSEQKSHAYHMGDLAKYFGQILANSDYLYKKYLMLPEHSKGSGFQLLENIEPPQINSHISANSRYHLEVYKFDPLIESGILVNPNELRADFDQFTSVNIINNPTFRDFLSSGGQIDDLRKLRRHFFSGLKAAEKVLQNATPFSATQLGINFSPSELEKGVGQFFSQISGEGQYSRVLHPNLNLLKYAMQLFSFHGQGHLGSLGIGVEDLRRIANASLGIYTSLAYVVKDMEGKEISTFVYPYTRSDKGMLSLDEMKKLYKQNYTSLELKQEFSGASYLKYLNQYNEYALDKISHAKKMRGNYNADFNNLVKKYLPSSISLEKEQGVMHHDFAKKFQTYLEKVSVATLDSTEWEDFKKILVVEMKRNLLIVAYENLDYHSVKYRNMLLKSLTEGQNVFSSRDIEDFTSEEIDKLLKEFIEDKTIKEGDLYNYRRKIGNLNFAEFIDDIGKQGELDHAKFKELLLGKEIQLNYFAKKAIDKNIYPLLNNYLHRKSLDIKNTEPRRILQAKMKLDFLEFAVSEHGYRNEKLKKLDTSGFAGIFNIKNLHLGTPEYIDEIMKEFLHDDDLSRFSHPGGDEQLKGMVAYVDYKNPQLHHYRDFLGKIDFEEMTKELESLHEASKAVNEYTRRILNDITPETCDKSSQILQLAGLNPDEILVKEGLKRNERLIFSNIEKSPLSKFGEGGQSFSKALGQFEKSMKKIGFDDSKIKYDSSKKGATATGKFRFPLAYENTEIGRAHV